MSPALLSLFGLALLPEPPPQAPLVISPAVAQMVMVDAFVTDRKGRPITTLRIEDFELLEDGKGVEIAAFQPPGPRGDGPGQRGTDRLTLLVNSLLGLTGRKSLVYISEGLEQRPGIHLFDQIPQICPEVLQRDAPQVFAAMQEVETSAPLRDVVARANAARVTFYPVDARGLPTSSSADLSQSDRTYVPTAGNDRVKDASFTAPLHLLAEETGGFALLRGLDPKTAMKRFDADENGHYIIGFVPGEADGKIHRLRVRLKDRAESRHHPDIRHRQAYLRAELPARRGQRSLSALLFGLEENALHADATVERTSPTSALVRVSVPASSLGPWPDAKSTEARVEVVISLRPANRERSAVTVKEKDVTFSLDPDAAGGNRREVVVDVPVGAGAYEFAIGVEDVATGSST